ncbi:MAG: ABC transporter permease [Chloroflexi bacterium]|nr:ABC transporter permease [Chloroflexota bacterium]
MNAVLTIAQRDLNKLLRDRTRLLSTFIFPFVFLAALGGTMQANLGTSLGYDFLAYTFTGVLAQTLFQSAAMGLISVIEDRENDFSQEIFIAPVSRYAIVAGKLLGETLVALPQGLAVVAFALLLGVSISVGQLLAFGLVSVAVCLFGGAFGLVVLSNLSSQRAAQQVFPFILLPQFFLAGIFNPIQVLPWYLDILSRLSPLRYAVDLTRNVFYLGQPEYGRAVLNSLAFNATIMSIAFGLFVAVGTFLFVRAERNR